MGDAMQRNADRALLRPTRLATATLTYRPSGWVCLGPALGALEHSNPPRAPSALTATSVAMPASSSTLISLTAARMM